MSRWLPHASSKFDLGRLGAPSWTSLPLRLPVSDQVKGRQDMLLHPDATL